jgi:hypothetical protein
MEDRRCKLGLQGRLELVRLVEQGAPLVASLGGGERGRARVVGVSAHAVLAAAVVSMDAQRRG